MKNLYLDTNVLVDFLLARQPFSTDAAALVQFAADGRITLFASTLSFATCYYLTRKKYSHEQVKEALRKLSDVVTVLDTPAAALTHALASDFKDFEDAIQYFSAQASATGLDAIITRDVAGFELSTLPVLEPAYARALLSA